MKRRSSLRSNCRQEEEEQSRVRKHSLRKRKCFSYEDHDGKDDVEEENYNHKPPYNWDKELWPVTCGTKKGIMDFKNLSKGKKCIECEGRQFTPPAFEAFGGKGPSKKWKVSIYSDGKPLQHWFDEGLLVTKGYLKKRTKCFKKTVQTLPNNGDESAQCLRQQDSGGSSISMEESEAEVTEDSEDEDVTEGCSGHNNLKAIGGVEDSNDVNSRRPEERQDDTLDELEVEEDGDELDNPESLCAPKETDHRLIISTPEKLALQMKWKVMLKRLSMKISEREAITEAEEKKDRDSVMKYGEKENDNNMEELLEMYVPDMSTNTSPQQLGVEEEIPESSEQTTPEKSIQDSDSTHISDLVETSAAEVLAGCDEDTMDLDQLQREKLKLQLEVLSLQKEYYTLKLNNLKRWR